MAHCLIIGGTKGLGRELSGMLSQRGDRVSVVGRTSPPAGADSPEGIHRWGADIGDETGFAGVLEEVIVRNGPLNYLVFAQRYRGESDRWGGELSVSLTGTKFVIESLTSRFAPSGDKAIVMVSSVFADYVGEGQDISYHVAKAGLNQLARFYAVDLGRKGIRVNTVTPFTFLKAESKSFYLNNRPLMDLYSEITPLGRMGTTEDTAKVIAFLCSGEASFVNGQNIYIDGGLSLVWPETLARHLRSI